MIPAEYDTKVLHRTELTISGMRCYEEKWSWDGFIGNSVIFPREYKVDGYSDAQLIDTVSRYIDTAQSLTFCVKRTSEFIFVNFVIDEENNDSDSDLSFNYDNPEQRKRRLLEYVKKRNHRD
jgi:hypothetical protein